MSFKKVVILSLLVLVVVIFIQAFIVQRVNNFTDDMSYTIEKNEKVFINKAIYGSRLPITLLTLPFTYGHVYNDLIVFPVKRLPGFSKVKRGDVVALNYPVMYDLPIDKKRRYIHRVVGLPGETIEISYGEIRIDDEVLGEDYPTLNKYRVSCDSVEFPSYLVQKYKIPEINFVSDPWIYDIIMSNQYVDSLKSENIINSVRQLTELKRKMIYDIYPHSNYYAWNKDNFGPVLIPSKGSKIPFNFRTYYLYRDVLENYENNQITLDGEQIFCNGKQIQTYEFKKNYYFVMGDNRHYAKDSRYWGFLPEDHIIGKVHY